MENNDHIRRDRQHNRFWAGLILVGVGACLLLRNSGVALPYWLFTWPMIVILAGIYTGLKYSFRSSSWIVIVGVGVFFLLDEAIPSIKLEPYFWPAIIIAIGLLFIVRPKRRRWCGNNNDATTPPTTTNTWQRQQSTTQQRSYTEFEETASAEQAINTTAIFGAVKKVIISKDFKGGNIVAFMGGTEINLSQADINGQVYIDVTQFFGGTKLIVPSGWEVRSDVISIFAGLEDKRQFQGITIDPNKVLILKGTSVFAGIEIKSY